MKTELKECPKCGSTEINKHGFRKTQRQGKVQKYSCKKCNAKFSDSELFRMKNSSEYISEALKLHAKGLSYRTISNKLTKQFHLKIAHTTVMNWITDFNLVNTAEEYNFTISGKSFDISFEIVAEPKDVLMIVSKLIRKSEVTKKSNIQ